MVYTSATKGHDTEHASDRPRDCAKFAPERSLDLSTRSAQAVVISAIKNGAPK